MQKCILVFLHCVALYSLCAQQVMEIEGAIIIKDSDDSTTTAEGMIRYNQATKTFEGFNGEWVPFNGSPADDIQFVYDIDGNKYRTVKIGQQLWMRENLRVSHYNDGISIPEKALNAEWNQEEAAWCWYDNNSEFDEIYGKLYNWWVIDTATNGGRNVCPSGWHVPTESEWNILIDSLGGEDIAGGALKNVQCWKLPNTGATNESGFSAKPNGGRFDNGSFDLELGEVSFVWTNSKVRGTPLSASSFYNSEGIFLEAASASKGFGIRCIKDANDQEETEPLNEIPEIKGNGFYKVRIIDGDNNPNLVFASGQSHDEWNGHVDSIIPLKLDIYEPENAPPNRPVILMIHGGTLEFGSRKDKQLTEAAIYFSERGWVVLSIDYRLEKDMGTTPFEWEQYVNGVTSPNNYGDFMSVYPANRDAKAALRWLYKNAALYHINTKYITLFGNSAGASICIGIGTTEPEDFTNEINISMDSSLMSTHLDYDSKVHTIVDFWGFGEHVSLLNNVYGLNRFDIGDPPILIVHGDQDQIVPYRFAEMLRDIYDELGATYEFHQLEGWGHEAWNAEVNGASLLALAFDFIVRNQTLKLG